MKKDENEYLCEEDEYIYIYRCITSDVIMKKISMQLKCLIMTKQ